VSLASLTVKAALIAIVVASSTAHADTIFELPNGWTAVPAPGPLRIYKDANGAVLAITRADVPNPNAWRSKTKVAYADEVERGLGMRIAGYRRTSKKLGSANGIPALDVEATRDGGATVVVRVLLFRTYALALAIEVPPKGDLAVARAIAQKFAPPPDPSTN
jgi:hypothetical protein